MYPRPILLFAGIMSIATAMVPSAAAVSGNSTTSLNLYALPETDDELKGEGPIRRYDWFRDIWKKRRQGFADRAVAERGSVVFFGDSITQFWGDNFQGDFGELAVANRGISGDTTRGMLIRLQEDVLSLSPSAVIMLMGTNDLEERAEPHTIAANIRLIIDAIEEHSPDAAIFLCLIFPSSEAKKRPADKIQKANRLMAAAVKGDPQVTLLDTWTLFANEKGDAKPEEFPDLLHPNRDGYKKWKAALWPILEAHGLVDRAERDDLSIRSGYRSLFNGTVLYFIAICYVAMKLRSVIART